MSAPVTSTPHSTTGSPDGPRKDPSRPLWRRVADSSLPFLAPFLVVYGAFLVWPLLNGLWMSFTDIALNGAGGAVIGLANYAEALGDPMVWRSLGNTVFFTLITTVPLVVVSLAMAVLVHTGLPGQWLWRLSFFMPFLFPVATVALVWNFLYVEDFGFTGYRFGYSAAISYLFLALVLVVAAVQLWVTTRRRKA